MTVHTVAVDAERGVHGTRGENIDMIEFLRRTRKALVLVVAAAAGCAGLAFAAPSAMALGAGEVCLFNAPAGADVAGQHLGHVGWAFSVPGSSTWEFGATESTTYNWRSAGPEATVLKTFRGQNGFHIATHYYTQYRCHSTPNSSVTAASNEVNALYRIKYNLADSNCLTRSIAIFKAYSSVFDSLGSGVGVFPNWYYDHLDQSGFSGNFTL